MLTPRRLLSLGLAFAAALALPTFAAGPRNRIALVDPGTLSTLEHSIPARARLSTDLGPAASGRRLSAVTLHFSRSDAQQAALDQLLADQQNPASPRYRQWLTPAQFGQQFGLSSADVARVTAWLTAQGLTLEEVSPVNTFVRVSGTVAQLDHAFGANLHSLTYAGEPHISNLSDPQLPAAIAAVTSGVTGLSDFLPHSHARAVTVRPNFTSALTNNHYLSPADFNTIYDLTPLANSAINGTGTSIAVMGQTDISLSDVAAFRSAAGLPTNQPTVLLNGSDPGTVSADLLEAQLDVEWSGAVAPRATVTYVNTASSNGGVFNSLIYAVTRATAPIISISYGLCELSASSASIYTFNNYLQQANVQGQTIVSAGGDVGATDCDYQSITAADGLAVDFPASSPYATGVGGTMFNDTGSPATYWQTASSSTGDIVSSAKSYIPETVWNEYSSTTGLAAGGGGSSVLFSKPAWQVAAGVPADSSRDVPDIALNAAASHVPYLVCSSGSCTSGFRNSAQNLTAVGGTSAGVPSFAGILALIEQTIGAARGLGNVNPTLYAMASSSYSSAFHDITSGNNNSPCATGSPNCTTGSVGYTATTGYDLASGLGSVDAYNMANLWASTTPATTVAYPGTGSRASATTVALASGQLTCGLQSSTVTLNVTETAGATGIVQLLVDGSANGSPVTLANSAATLSLSTSLLASGAHTISVSYSGDGNFAPSRGSLTLPTANTISNSYLLYVPSTLDVVSASQPDFSLTPCLPTVTVRTGTTSTPLTLAASSFNGFTGPVTFSVSSDSNLLAQYVLSSSTATVSTSAPGTVTLAISAFETTGSNSVPRSLLWSVGGTGVALALLACWRLPRPRRHLGLLLALVSVASLSLSGCGSGVATIPPGSAGSGSGSRTNTATGSYIVNVSATGTNSLGQRVTHTTYLTLTVTN